jgi:hypothetical protein
LKVISIEVITIVELALDWKSLTTFKNILGYSILIERKERNKKL